MAPPPFLLADGNQREGGLRALVCGRPREPAALQLAVHRRPRLADAPANLRDSPRGLRPRQVGLRGAAQQRGGPDGLRGDSHRADPHRGEAARQSFRLRAGHPGEDHGEPEDWLGGGPADQHASAGAYRKGAGRNAGDSGEHFGAVFRGSAHQHALGAQDHAVHGWLGGQRQQRYADLE